MPFVKVHPRRPQPDQVDEIKRLSEEILGDPAALFREVGYPTFSIDAAEMIVVLRKHRAGIAPAAGSEEDLHNKILTIAARDGDPTPPTTEEDLEPMPPPDTRTCIECNLDLPVEAFTPRGRGLSRVCNSCLTPDELAGGTPSGGVRATEAGSLPAGELVALYSTGRTLLDVVEDPLLSELVALALNLEDHGIELPSSEDPLGLGAALKVVAALRDYVGGQDNEDEEVAA